MPSQNAQGVIVAFAVIGLIVLVGYAIRRSGVIGEEAELTLNRIAFFLATPALLFTVISGSDVSELFSGYILAALIPIILCLVLLIFLLRGLRKDIGLPELAILSGAGVWVNANNMGIPIALYVLGDASNVAPILLLQLLIFSPILLLVLDLSRDRRISMLRVLTQPLRNPIIIASALGIVVSATGTELPDFVMTPIDMLGSAAIPLMLLAFGISIHGARPLSSTKGYHREIWIVTAVKLLLMPLLTLLVGRYWLNLDDGTVLALVIVAALPTAQNIYNFASRYQVVPHVSRDIVLITTLLAAPLVFLIAVLLG